jgi:DNA-binding CsgD family transcriptional regulator
VVPSDGHFLAATDPQTTLCIGAGVVMDLPEDQCAPTWDYEFLVPDYLKFADIAASGRAVADLHEATGGRPERSARWREYSSATGFRAELRSAFTLDGAMWGMAQFDRLGDSPRFTDVEKAWLECVAPILARGLRRAMVSGPASGPAARGPGLVLMYAATGRAASRDGAEGEVPRGRLRTRSGLWLLVHGSLMPQTGQLALIIEPAKAADVAPLIVEAYGLRPRELDVTRLIARGLGTSQIAAELHLSPHTVRDHVKAVFEKVGVSSRGELVAKMFADHYHDDLGAALEHAAA